MSEQQPEAEELARELRRVAETAGGKGISGAQIGTLLRAKWPDFSAAKFGAPSLREFIKTKVPELGELRRAGSDIVYGPKDAAPAASEESAEDNRPDLWRVWISPSSPYSIAINRDTGDTREAFAGTTSPDEVETRPVPVHKHRAIAGEFLGARAAALEEDARDRLTQVLNDSEDPRWWQRWNEILKAASPQLSRHWFLYREHALGEALKEMLKTSGLGEEAQTRAFERISTSRHRRPISRPQTRGEPTTSVRKAAHENERPEPNRHEQLVRLVQRVASRMSEGELRAVALPLGLVLDVLCDKPKS